MLGTKFTLQFPPQWLDLVLFLIPLFLLSTIWSDQSSRNQEGWLVWFPWIPSRCFRRRVSRVCQQFEDIPSPSKTCQELRMCMDMWSNMVIRLLRRGGLSGRQFFSLTRYFFYEEERRDTVIVTNQNRSWCRGCRRFLVRKDFPPYFLFPKWIKSLNLWTLIQSTFTRVCNGNRVVIITDYDGEGNRLSTLMIDPV